MASAISSYTIGSDLKADPDYLMEGQSVVAVGSSPITSGIVLNGKTQDQLEIVGRVVTAVTVPNAEIVSLTLQYADDAAFTVNAGSIVVYSLTSSGGDVLAADAELFRYAPTIEKGTYWRVVLTTTLTAASGTIDIYPVLIG